MPPGTRAPAEGLLEGLSIMRSWFWSGWIVGLGGCAQSLEVCVVLCEVKGACLEEEIDAFDSDWEDWTGYDDRDDYEDACLDVFIEASAVGRRSVQTCSRQLEAHSCELEPS